MKLKEFEAKQLLKDVGIETSSGNLITSSENIPPVNFPVIVKAQTIANGRGKAGGVLKVNNSLELSQAVSKFINKNFLMEQITEILLDQPIEARQELYLGISFDTSKKCPVLMFNSFGGINIEENKAGTVKMPLNYLQGLTEEKAKEIPLPFELLNKFYNCFIKFDCKMLEINPLILTPDGKYIAVDAVAVLDDDAQWRSSLQFPQRTDNRLATAREAAARKIDAEDHRGVAGKTFIDLPGDIAILTSGGGASMTIMDALIEYGGKPANFTEYSGDPPREKVEKLTRIVLDKANLSGLLVAGVIANFTNIAETIQGIVNVLKEKKPAYPIVIRRAGPQDDKARLIIKEAKDYGLDINYFDEQTTLTDSVKFMVHCAKHQGDELK